MKPNNKAKEIALMLSLGGLVAGCAGKKIEEKQAEYDSAKQKLELAQREVVKGEADSADIVYAFVDSVRKTPEFSHYDSVARSGDIYDIQNSIHNIDLYRSHPNYYKLLTEIRKNAENIFIKYKKQIMILLQQFNMDTDIVDKIFKYTTPDNYMYAKYYDKDGDLAKEQPCVFDAYECVGFVQFELEGALNDSNYGEQRKQEIRDGINKILDNMRKELGKSRENIEKGYGRYYPKFSEGYKKNHPGFDPALRFSEGEPYLCYPGEQDVPEGGQDAPVWANVIYCYKTISVYDQNLSPYWFNIPGASYRLVDLKDGKFQVERTIGKQKTRTKVFQDSAKWHTYECQDDHGNSNLTVNPGKNLGVHVYYTVKCCLYTSTEKDVLDQKTAKDLKEQESSLQAQLQQITIANRAKDSIENSARDLGIARAKAKKAECLAEMRNKVRTGQHNLAILQAQLDSLQNKR